jgi:hypothetical protein
MSLSCVKKKFRQIGRPAGVNVPCGMRLACDFSPCLLIELDSAVLLHARVVEQGRSLAFLPARSGGSKRRFSGGTSPPVALQ